MSYLRRLRAKMFINFSQSDCYEKMYKLHQMLDEAFSISSGLQQPPCPTSEGGRGLWLLIGSPLGLQQPPCPTSEGASERYAVERKEGEARIKEILEQVKYSFYREDEL